MTREEVIATSCKIAELRAEVARLAQAQKELKKLEAILDDVTGTVTESGRASRGDSIEQQVGEFLLRNLTRDWSGEEVAKELSTKVPTTRAAFSKLRKAGRIVNTSRGRVQAKPVDTEPAPPGVKGIELVA